MLSLFLASCVLASTLSAINGGVVIISRAGTTRPRIIRDGVIPVWRGGLTRGGRRIQVIDQGIRRLGSFRDDDWRNGRFIGSRRLRGGPFGRRGGGIISRRGGRWFGDRRDWNRFDRDGNGRWGNGRGNRRDGGRDNRRDGRRDGRRDNRRDGGRDIDRRGWGNLGRRGSRERM